MDELTAIVGEDVLRGIFPTEGNYRPPDRFRMPLGFGYGMRSPFKEEGKNMTVSRASTLEEVAPFARYRTAPPDGDPPAIWHTGISFGASPHRLTKLGELKEDSQPTLGLSFLLSDIEGEQQKVELRKIVAYAFADIHSAEYDSRVEEELRAKILQKGREEGKTPAEMAELEAIMDGRAPAAKKPAARKPVKKKTVTKRR